ncbi:IS701 family transposase [Bacteroidales bacterium]|nr:IS701 family transposase [Bacteroidales bacterium]
MNFKVYRRDNTQTAINYLKGLFFCSKGEANMERMEEEISDSEYRAYQHFISNSTWDWEGLQKQVAQETSALLVQQKLKNNLPIGYIVDESAHLKKGTKSVGVSRQYAGVIGKVDNCQVGVYASLVNKTSASLINERIFLPKTWTDDKSRCKEAKVPKEHQSFKTKPQLALEMIKQDIERGITFDWMGGDGLYGHNTELCNGLDELNCFYVLDVHKDEKVYLQEPGFYIPESKSGKGRKAIKLHPDVEPVRLDKLIKSLPVESWSTEEIRDTVKGKLILWVYKSTVWTWDGKSKKAKKRVLIITKTTDSKPKTKYSLSNGESDNYTHKEYAYFVSQRYWVERSFDNAKNELGMSDYQIRKWQSWHTHHAIVMMASLYITTQLIEHQDNVPLLSFRDARILLVANICATQVEIEEKAIQMHKRHKKRKADILRRFCKQKEKLKL